MLKEKQTMSISKDSIKRYADSDNGHEKEQYKNQQTVSMRQNSVERNADTEQQEEQC